MKVTDSLLFLPNRAKCVTGLKKTKKKIRVGLDPHLVGNGLSLFKSFAISDAVVISMHKKLAYRCKTLCGIMNT